MAVVPKILQMRLLDALVALAVEKFQQAAVAQLRLETRLR